MSIAILTNLFSRLYSFSKQKDPSLLKFFQRLLYCLGSALIFAWAGEALFFLQPIKNPDYFLFSFFCLITASHTFTLAMEIFLRSWIKTHHPSFSREKRERFLRHTFFPLYFGSLWLLLPSFFILRISLQSSNSLSLGIYLNTLIFILPWVVLTLSARKVSSNRFLTLLPQKIEKERSAVILYSFLAILIVINGALFTFMTLKPLVKKAETMGKHIEEMQQLLPSLNMEDKKIFSKEIKEEVSNYKEILKSIFQKSLSTFLFPICILLFCLMRHLTYLPIRLLCLILPKLFLFLFPITAMMMICPHPDMTTILWPFHSSPIPSFLHPYLPGIHQPLNMQFSGHLIWAPFLWFLSIWFWRNLQKRAPLLEAWFRLFLTPTALFLLPQATYSCFFNFVGYSQSYLFSFGFVGILITIFKSYIAGAEIYATKLFKDGDVISIPGEAITQGEVISIDLMTTKIKLLDGGAIRSIPNQCFSSLSIEKVPKDSNPECLT